MDGQPLVHQAAFPGVDVKKFHWQWQSLFLACASVTAVSSIMGLWSMLSSIIVSPFDVVLFVYLTIFSLVLLILDAPSSVSSTKMHELGLGVYKYCLFLTRFTGRGVFYVFLGTMLTGVLWDNDISPILGFGVGTFLCVAGGLTMYHGVNLSRKLQQVKMALLNRGGPTGSICPPQGLRKEKFAEIADKMQGVKFTKDELTYITRAMSLSWHADDIISQREFENWIHDTQPLLI